MTGPWQALTGLAGSLVRRGRHAVGRFLMDFAGTLERAAQKRLVQRETPKVPAESFGRALQTLRDLGLVTPVESADGKRHWIVHRWTSRALARIAAADKLREAHERAARYWRLRRERLPQEEPKQAVAELLEERHHRRRAGQRGWAFVVTDLVKRILFSQGQYRLLEQLYREMLPWYPPGSYEVGSIQQLLGNLAERVGDYGSASTWFRKSLATFEELGDDQAIGRAHHNLGMMVHLHGDSDGAIGHFEKALERLEVTGEDPESIALSYHNLGVAYELRGSYERALAWSRKAWAVFDALDDQAGIARCHHQLGEVARKRGNLHLAVVWHQSALGYWKRLDDRAGIARSSHHLGMVSQESGLLEEATGHYRRAAEIAEELGDLAAMANAYHNLGCVAQLRGALDTAESWYRRSLEIEERLGSASGIAASCNNLGLVAEARGRTQKALGWYRRAAEPG